MKNITWKEVLEGVGIFAIVASLIFVSRQLQQDHRIARAQISAEMDSSAIELAQALHENGKAWRDGLDGKDQSADDKLIFLTLVRAVETHYRGRSTRARQLDIGDPQVFVQNYAFEIYQYPGLRSAFIYGENSSDLRRNAFGRDDIVGFLDAVTEALEVLDDTKPDVPEKDYILVK